MSKYRINNELYFKSMIGINYIFHAIPDEISSFSGQIGLEFRYYLTKFLNFYISNDVILASVNFVTPFFASMILASTGTYNVFDVKKYKLSFFTEESFP